MLNISQTKVKIRKLNDDDDDDKSFKEFFLILFEKFRAFEFSPKLVEYEKTFDYFTIYLFSTTLYIK
ncbi:hypothetical protein DERP_013559 [Dermatophagoides pteronyssinus]|uniref:Uncharacterized protein n=1 Tax=Dermatophagoides pteronyssinus TaxID=6956 RepID=A0ABQ8J5D1_DERPT|nr:hypothetical protein DERP_013559 [Dermatophagoides pteronyssinus]